MGAFFIGIISGFMSAVGGGGSLISVPFLLFLGLPPQITLATNKFSGLGAAYTASGKYLKENKVVWKYFVGLLIAGILASVIGTQILIKSSPAFLNQTIGIFLLILVPTIFLKKDFGLKKIEIDKKYNYLGYLFYFLLSIIASFFGGVGPIMVSSIVFFFGLPFIEANATDYLAFSIFSTVAVLVYIFNGLVNYEIGIVLFVGMAIGGYMGAHTAIKKGNEWVKIFFAVLIVLSAIKILFKL
jgi:uncharacterized membrane protein YfcA